MNLTLDLQIASESSEGLPSEADFRKWAKAAVEDFRDDAEVTIRIVDEGRVRWGTSDALVSGVEVLTADGHETGSVVATGDPVLRVHFIDVGQGDATLIDYGQMEILIDGGDNKAGNTVVSYLSSYVDGPLDYLIATHPDADHVGGLDDVLAAFQVNEIIDSGYPATTKTYQKYWAAAQAEPDSILTFDEDRVIPLGPDTVLSVIETGDAWTTPNDSSVVCQLICGNVTVLFTGDMSQTAEQASLSLFGDVDVLKVAHHGSASSTCKEFLQVVNPEYAVVSYLVGNSYHHPTLKALQRLFDQGTTVYGTGKSGSIILTTDGQTYAFNTDLALTMADAGT